MTTFRTLAASLLAAAVAISGAAAQETREAASVVAIKSTSERYDDTLLLRGRTEATRRVEVKAETAGLVTSQRLPKGTLVNKGDILCQIEEYDRQAELTEALARLKEAEIESTAAERLAQRGFGATTTANTKEAALVAAKAQVLRAEVALDRLKIRAPFAGILETDTAEIGSLLQNGTVCASVITLHPIKLVAFAPERSVDQLKIGADVVARLITGQTIKGDITYIARSAERNTRTYLVEAETSNLDLSIRDGMTTEMRILLEGRPAHLLPQTSLTLNDNGDLGVRLVVKDQAKFMPVRILRDEQRGVWVSGLPEQISVIVVGQEFVTDGQPLKVTYLPQEVSQ